ncbi:hypothetical protein EYF80_039117 [Liparis tanakae]|uniref:Uncharacterized protein n=1 Tax=Liparis tanakae TaxID=230148 RepID=A0A4Z2GAP5_9TELE|nr:hypothetical protein EYF80_039117 [Liparis tanakae]
MPMLRIDSGISSLNLPFCLELAFSIKDCFRSFLPISSKMLKVLCSAPGQPCCCTIRSTVSRLLASSSRASGMAEKPSATSFCFRNHLKSSNCFTVRFSRVRHKSGAVIAVPCVNQPVTPELCGRNMYKFMTLCLQAADSSGHKVPNDDVMMTREDDASAPEEESEEELR